MGAFLLVDMAHISGLVASGESASPFEYADIVTTTTHKSLRGPRAGMIFFRRVGKVDVSWGRGVGITFFGKVDFHGVMGDALHMRGSRCISYQE